MKRVREDLPQLSSLSRGNLLFDLYSVAVEPSLSIRNLVCSCKPVMSLEAGEALGSVSQNWHLCEFINFVFILIIITYVEIIMSKKFFYYDDDYLIIIKKKKVEVSRIHHYD